MQVSNHIASKTLIINKIQIHYREVGVGQPIILLHGWGSNADSFSHLEQHLSSNFRILSLDLPGFGASEAPPCSWHLNDYVNLVKAFLNSLDISTPAIVGHSFGGRIAICLAAQNLLSKLILVNSAGVRPRRNPLYYTKIYSYKFAKYLVNIAPHDLRPILLNKLQQRFGSSDYRNASPLLRQILVNVVNDDLSSLFPSIKIPTLLIWGENDTTTPLYQAKAMEANISDAGLVVIKDAGHFCYIDKPAEFNIIADYFLQH